MFKVAGVKRALGGCILLLPSAIFPIVDKKVVTRLRGTEVRKEFLVSLFDMNNDFVVIRRSSPSQSSLTPNSLFLAAILFLFI
jgi:hypothetical protein